MGWQKGITPRTKLCRYIKLPQNIHVLQVTREIVHIILATQKHLDTIISTQCRVHWYEYLKVTGYWYSRIPVQVVHTKAWRLIGWLPWILHAVIRVLEAEARSIPVQQLRFYFIIHTTLELAGSALNQDRTDISDSYQVAERPLGNVLPRSHRVLRSWNTPHSTRSPIIHTTTTSSNPIAPKVR